MPDRSVPRRRLLLHESFHRIQDDLGLPMAPADNPHMDDLEGRYWLLLELRALAAALRGEDRGQAIADALAFRTKRRSFYAEAAANERALEINEGLAEYTGIALRGTSEEENRLAIARRLEQIDRSDSFVRSFAYSTGPAYGLLLDVVSPEWRATFKPTMDLAATLASVAHVAGAPEASTRARDYGGSELRVEETARAQERAALVERYRSRLVEGPVLEIPLEGANFGFDPYTLVPMGEHGTAYPALEVTGAWGRISTVQGARIDAARTRLVFSIEDRSRLELEPSWTLRPGERAGDLVLGRGGNQER